MAEPSIFPPWWFVERWNANPDNRGAPYATALDPLVMMAWHLVTEPARKPYPLVQITGC